MFEHRVMMSVVTERVFFITFVSVFAFVDEQSGLNKQFATLQAKNLHLTVQFVRFYLDL